MSLIEKVKDRLRLDIDPIGGGERFGAQRDLRVTGPPKREIRGRQEEKSDGFSVLDSARQR